MCDVMCVQKNRIGCVCLRQPACCGAVAEARTDRWHLFDQRAAVIVGQEWPVTGSP